MGRLGKEVLVSLRDEDLLCPGGLYRCPGGGFRLRLSRCFDTGKAIKKLFLGTPDLYGDFTARIDLEALSNDSLVAFGRQYDAAMLMLSRAFTNCSLERRFWMKGAKSSFSSRVRLLTFA